MMLLLFSVLNPLELFPDSVDVAIRNGIEETSILSIHYIVNGTTTMNLLRQHEPILPAGFEMIRIPYRYLGRIVFGTSTGENYRKVAVALNPSGDTLCVSREDREFGGFFDVIMGSSPHIIRNTSPVPLMAVFLHGDSLPEGSVLGSNPLMTDETLFLWLDRDSVAVSALDIEGNPSDTLLLIRSGIDSVFSIGTLAFMTNVQRPSPGTIWVINGINGERISGIEVYPLLDEPFFFDLAARPLGLWQSAAIPFAGEIEFIVCIDTEERSYSINSLDEVTGAYIADWWHLDFDYSFPGRRRR